jgi:hypothetical protein
LDWRCPFSAPGMTGLGKNGRFPAVAGKDRV